MLLLIIALGAAYTPTHFLKPIHEIIPTDLRLLDDNTPYNFLDSYPSCKIPVRTQEHCGSCWAFGSTEAFANRICRSNTSFTLNISPQELVSCCTSSSYGCAGGDEYASWEYFRDYGIHTETAYPYLSGKDMISRDCITNLTTFKYFAVNIRRIANSISAIQNEIKNYGPVTCPMNVYIDFVAYKSGIYTRKSNINLGGHVVTVIGWNSESGQGYWIVKNLWGETWGESGYFKIAFGQSGIESQCVAGDFSVAHA